MSGMPGGSEHQSPMPNSAWRAAAPLPIQGKREINPLTSSSSRHRWVLYPLLTPRWVCADCWQLLETTSGLRCTGGAAAYGVNRGHALREGSPPTFSGAAVPLGGPYKGALPAKLAKP
jgi:hypothetical protein